MLDWAPRRQSRQRRSSRRPGSSRPWMAEEQHRERVIRRPLPEWTSAITRAAEPLWISSTAALFIVWGYSLIPRLIRLLGHSGQAETIEWAVYMSMLVGFPIACIIVALALPRIFKGTLASIVKSFVV